MASFGWSQTEKTTKTAEIDQRLYYAHEVMKGQTVYGLCRLYEVAEKEFYQYNPQAEKGLKAGEIIYILISSLKIETYTVKKGETYYSIAKNRGITETELKKFNPDKGTVLSIGDTLYVPVVELEENIVTSISTPKTKKEEKKEKAEEKKETIIPIETPKPTSEEDESSALRESKKGEYTVSVLIPLYLSDVDIIEPSRIKSLADYGKVKSFSFIQFYEALLLAAEDITNEYPKIKINLNIEDVSSSSQMTELINSGRLEHTDLIIGPFFSKEFSLLCQYVQKKKILIVNPFSVNFENCGAKVYKSTASLRFQGEQFAKYVAENYENARVIFANYQGNEENEKINAYKSAMQPVFSKSGKQISIQEVNLVNNGISGIQSAMYGNAENFVFTFFDGELRVTNFVQNLHKVKNSNLTLVAPQSWLNYDNIETEYFMDMKTHYISQYFVDYSHPNVIRFIDAFRSAYDTEPTLELFAFQGYDFTYYFLSNLCENGANFQVYSAKNSKLLSTQFEFVRISHNMLENSFVRIFKLKDYEYIDATKQEKE